MSAHGPESPLRCDAAIRPELRAKRKLASRARNDAIDPKRTRQMIRLAGGVVFDYVVPMFNMVTSTAKDSNGA